MRRSIFKICLSIGLCLSLMIPLLACKKKASVQENRDVSSYGSEFAERFAKANRFRKAYSDGEKASAQLIKTELDKLGLRYVEQTFTKADDSNQSSSNIIVRFPGRGFKLNNEEPDQLAFMNTNSVLPQDQQGLNPSGTPITPLPAAERETPIEAPVEAGSPLLPREPGQYRMVVAAHYDTPVGADQAQALPNYDGINDSASSVATLLDLARRLKDQQYGYDVELVFLGARYDQGRGAQVYYEKAKDEKIPLESAIFIDGIYAGDKLYAHSGRQSLKPNQKYMMRRKVYALTDVYLRYSVYDEYGVGLYTNQANFMVDVPNIEGPQLYREFSLKESDYRIFDEAGLPVVFIDSWNYRGKKLDDLKENTLLNFIGQGGKITGTNSEQVELLESVFEKNQLRDRINATAFMIEKLILFGIYGMVAA